MTPSKENCVKALELMKDIDQLKSVEAQFVRDFLAAAAKRLPREESLARDRDRRRATARATTPVV